ncbi:peptide synthetase [Sinomonas cellulolyticus]|uniref:Amino acid synthesis family protein n=1 Tax=Sinomonas cellulolyticus TaxID=2801916 RepID=A0ABS1K3R6_9MICC|nr:MULTISPECIES: amino acid synthesis family protein [Sinomonas]MBL0705937.1 amino acid synthesis family protein [Sinomonas cellulolyticus]GHG42727.1 peptide synthetase [Sinomonas sp. KCTC 49339]
MGTLTTLTGRGPAASLEEAARAVGVRRIVVQQEEILRDGPGIVPTSVTQAAAAAVIRNPWAGSDVSTDLAPETERIAPVLAKVLTDRLNAVLGGSDEIEAFGKSAVVGLSGETEHAAALVHTPFFGNLVREFLDGSSILCFSDDRSEPGTSIAVPMWHKTAAATRSHYQTITLNLNDAPHPDEIVVIAAASTGPRPHPRIGDRTTDRPVTAEILEGILP